MNTFKAAWVLAVFAFGTSGWSSDIGNFISESKIADLKSMDIPQYEKVLTKQAGHPVKIDVKWKTFTNKVTMDGAQKLGSALHTIADDSVNQKDPAFVETLKKVKVIEVEQADSVHEARFEKSKKSGAVILRADFNALRWKEGEGFAAQLKKLSL